MNTCTVFHDWKKARLIPVHKENDEADTGNDRPLSMLSVPSKIMETCVADTLTQHVLVDNKLVTYQQWAYRKGHSAELFLVQLTEIWRKAIDYKLVVGVAFVDFQKAFDCVPHTALFYKLKQNFGINGGLLAWLKDYLKDRQQFTVVNGKQSGYDKVTYGIPQGSVLGPTLFALYTSDMPSAVTLGTVYLYADDTTVYCIGRSIDQVTALLIDALEELNQWCLRNKLTAQPTKCEAMLLYRGSFTGPLKPLDFGRVRIKWATHTRLVGITIDDQLNWMRHIQQ